MRTKMLANLFFGAMMLWGCSRQSTSQNQVLILKQNWKIQQSSKVKAAGEAISDPKFQVENWHDAQVPSTVMGVLSVQPKYADLFSGGNYYSADKSIFNESWWYRTSFSIDQLKKGTPVLLQFDGISYYANVWLNGKLIAGKDNVFGTFRRFELDVTSAIQNGENALAVEIFRQQPGDFGHGFVDWNPRPLDENMGIWRDVTVKIIDEVQLKNSFVRSKVNTETLDEAWLSIGTQLRNFSNKTLNGTLKLSIGELAMEYPVSMQAGEVKEIVLTSAELETLHLVNPKLWWCNGLGEPNLYDLKIEFVLNGKVKAEDNIRFGIREIDSYFNAEGHRGFKLNGKELLIKGAGWTDDIFLRDTETTNEIQVKYVADMGMNTIRFENIWGTTQHIYDLCDEHGLLAMVGWSCQWEWENYLGKPCDEFGGVTTEADIALVTQYMRDQVLWLRNHPSIFVWMVGSDMLPRPALEEAYIKLFSELDNRPWLGAASNRTSKLTGPTGVKMYGPYEYVGPSYWYLDKKNGGAYGFNTETGPGSQLPVIESIQKMLPEAERWPLSKAWDQHCTTSSAGMNSMKLQNEVVTAQYGTPTGLDDFVRKSHLSNYEAIRAMMEAFRVNRPSSTGIIQWMLNSAWPSLYWQVYDYYLVPTPAYYGVKKALQPVQLIFNYGNRSIQLSNETLKNVDNIKAKISVFDLNSKSIFSKEIDLNVVANSVAKLIDLPKFSTLAFLKMELITTKGELLSDNFYWLSAQPEEFDWDNNQWYFTPMKKYSNYADLNKLNQVELQVNQEVNRLEDEIVLTAELSNQAETMAFFTELKLKTEDGEWVVPSIFSDNYFTLMPGEKRIVEVKFPVASLKGQKSWLSISGWNVIPRKIEVKM